MTKQTSNTLGADTLAFIDEAGAGGYSRRLASTRDHELGLMCALLFPAARVEEFRNIFLPGYQKFREVMPDNAKLHITDAFAPGNKSQATVARSVRSEFFDLLCRHQIPVVYEARRLKLERDSYERLEDLVSKSKTACRSPIRISERASNSTVEEQLIFGLALKLDAFCEDAECLQVDLLFDNIDNNIAQVYRDVIESTRNIDKSSQIVEGWNSETKSRVQGEIFVEVNAPFPLNTHFLGKLCVVGKEDPLVLAADIVANSLYGHLQSLSPKAKLNSPTSISGWDLESRIYGVRDNAMEDII